MQRPPNSLRFNSSLPPWRATIADIMLIPSPEPPESLDLDGSNRLKY